MKIQSVIYMNIAVAQDLGFSPIYWPALEMTSDDRTPEIQVGFLEGAGYA